MKSISTILNIVFGLAIAVLFYFHFSAKHSCASPAKAASAANAGNNFKVAYFDIDTLQAYYQYYLDLESQMKSKETSSRDQLAGMSNTYQKRLGELQQKASGMTQAEGEAAQRELATLERQFNQKQMELDQELKKKQLDLLNDLHKKVEDYLKEYNKEHGYAYILSYQPGVLMYYKDSAYDISRDMIEGLNKQYKEEKSKK